MTRAFWIIVVATVVLSSYAGAADWPQFRGPNSSGIGDGKPPVEFGPSQNVLWKTAMGTAAPSPAEHLRCGRFTDCRRRLACAQPSRERRLLARRQSPRRQDHLEDGPFEVSIWMVDARVLAARRDR